MLKIVDFGQSKGLRGEISEIWPGQGEFFWLTQPLIYRYLDISLINRGQWISLYRGFTV
jgi:hypothetical protein